MAQIENLRGADQIAADIMGFTEGVTSYALHLEELTEKALHLADAVTEASIRAPRRDSEHLVKVPGTTCRARDDLSWADFPSPGKMIPTRPWIPFTKCLHLLN